MQDKRRESLAPSFLLVVECHSTTDLGPFEASDHQTTCESSANERQVRWRNKIDRNRVQTSHKLLTVNIFQSKQNKEQQHRDNSNVQKNKVSW